VVALSWTQGNSHVVIGKKAKDYFKKLYVPFHDNDLLSSIHKLLHVESIYRFQHTELFSLVQESMSQNLI